MLVKLHIINTKNNPFFSKNRGEGEAIRSLLYYVKIPFIDVRFDNKESFQDNTLLDTNIDPSQLPVLQLADENNTLLIKSVSSILRYIAKKAKSSDLLITLNPEILRLYPSDDIEAAKIDILLDQEKEFSNILISSDEVKVLEKLKMFENDIVAGGSGCYMGGRIYPSIADFCFAHRFKAIENGHFSEKIPSNTLIQFPQLLTMMAFYDVLNADKVDFSQGETL